MRSVTGCAGDAAVLDRDQLDGIENCHAQLLDQRRLEGTVEDKAGQPADRLVVRRRPLRLTTSLRLRGLAIRDRTSRRQRGRC
jgi:hypothetical protein